MSLTSCGLRAAGNYSVAGTRIIHDGTNWIGAGVNAFDQFGTANKGAWNIRIVREVVDDFSECPISASDGTLSTAIGYLHPLEDVVNYNRGHGVVTILCPFGWDTGSNQQILGLNPSSTAWFGMFKARLGSLAQRFANQPDVWIEVWNEPYAWDNQGFSEAQWVSDMNQLYASIRQVGNNNIIVIPSQANDGQETVFLHQGSFLSGKSNVVASIHCYNGWTSTTQTTSESRIKAIQATGWALLFGEVGPDPWVADCRRLLEASVTQHVSTIAWSWNASDGSALLTGGIPTAWGNQFLPYLSRYLPPLPTAPALQSGRLNGAYFQAWLTGDVSQNYTVLISTNLSSWNPLLSTNSPVMPWLFSDPVAPDAPYRFYRVTSGP